MTVLLIAADAWFAADASAAAVNLQERQVIEFSTEINSETPNIRSSFLPSLDDLVDFSFVISSPLQTKVQQGLDDDDTSLISSSSEYSAIEVRNWNDCHDEFPLMLLKHKIEHDTKINWY